METIAACVNSGLRINLGLLAVVLASQRNVSMEIFFFCALNYVCSKNDWQSKILCGQMVILAGHCPLTGRYVEP